MGVKSNSGNLFLFSSGNASGNGNRGLYTSAHGSGSGQYIIKLDTNNNAIFYGDLQGNATSASALTGIAENAFVIGQGAD